MATNNFSQALQLDNLLTSSKNTSGSKTSNPGTNSGAKNTNTNDKILRYPLKRIEDSTDYLRITVGQFKPSEFQPFKNQEVGNQISENLIKEVSSQKGISKEIRTSLFEFADITDRLGSNAVFSKKNLKYFITLPIPNNISDSNSVTWGEDRLNPLQSAGANAIAGVANEGVAAIGGAFDEIISKVPDANTKKAITAALAAAGVGSSPEALISRATGQVLNPNLELLFQGVNLRSFPFSFDFAPRSYDEGQMVMKIIKAFKTSMLPRTNNGGASGAGSSKGILISAPYVFQLQYMKGAKEHPFLNKFKPCALVDIQLNYTASGTYATYWDGTPVHMQMSLTFKELNPIYAEDYDNLKGGGVGY
jgi:hypothetical protein